MLTDAGKHRLIIRGAAGEEDDDEFAAAGELDVGGVVADFAGVAFFRPKFRAGRKGFAEEFFDLVLGGTRREERAFEQRHHGIGSLRRNGVAADDPE